MITASGRHKTSTTQPCTFGGGGVGSLASGAHPHADLIFNSISTRISGVSRISQRGRSKGASLVTRPGADVLSTRAHFEVLVLIEIMGYVLVLMLIVLRLMSTSEYFL